MVLVIASLNVRGLREVSKRREVFHYFNLKNFSIIFLQEMHSSKNIEHLWKSEWGHDMYIFHGSNESRGTGI